MLLLLSLLFASSLAFLPSEEEVFHSRWNSSYLQCNLIEVRLYSLAQYCGFNLAEKDMESLSVLWEKNFSPVDFFRKLIRHPLGVEPSEVEKFKILLAKEYSAKQKMIEKTIQSIGKDSTDRETVFKYTKELDFMGTVRLLRRAFAKTRPTFLEVESYFGSSFVAQTSDTQRAGKYCPEYLPLEGADEE